ncbi:MAG: hypothetical protein LBE31_11415 [Deltaproteobacteria bacterium]|jgi:hypothetical protein|nr:hypothetical protein [Deltaproteobacteria bacterium]
MSADDRDGRKKKRNDHVKDEDLNYEDSNYGDDVSLDIEMERIIKQLDKIAYEEPNVSDPPEDKPLPTLTARSPVPARDPRAPRSPSDMVVLTDRLEQNGRSKTGSGPDVVDLIDEVADIDDPYDVDDDDSPVSSTRGATTVADLTPDELANLISQAVETALRRFYSR